MTDTNSTTQSSSDSEKTFPAPAGQVTLVLDAPTEQLTQPYLPAQFRKMPTTVPNLSGIAASGSADFSALQFQGLLTYIGQAGGKFPLVVVDLRQEPHGLLELQEPLNGETEIAVGWFAERDWLNVAQGAPSIELHQNHRLDKASKTAGLTVYNVKAKSKTEDSIAAAAACPVKPTGTYQTESDFVTKFPSVSYLRLPTTDHCRPRDHEVDQFVALDASFDPTTWLHFHCRAGDGRTTTFMAMHDIIHNAPGDSLQTILARQVSIGGIDLSTMPTDQTIFSYPFSRERVKFIQNFYDYVCAAKPTVFKLTWSDWVINKLTQKQSSASA